MVTRPVIRQDALMWLGFNSVPPWAFVASFVWIKGMPAFQIRLGGAPFSSRLLASEDSWAMVF